MEDAEDEVVAAVGVAFGVGVEASEVATVVEVVVADIIPTTKQLVSFRCTKYERLFTTPSLKIC